MKHYILLANPAHHARGVICFDRHIATSDVHGLPCSCMLYLFDSRQDEPLYLIGAVENGHREYKIENEREFDSACILLGGEWILYGTSASKALDWSKLKKTASAMPFSEYDGFQWKKVDASCFPKSDPMILCIFHHTVTLKAIRQAGQYFLGIDQNKTAVAIKSKDNPFPHFTDCARRVGEYWIVCADRETRVYYSLF